MNLSRITLGVMGFRRIKLSRCARDERKYILRCLHCGRRLLVCSFCPGTTSGGSLHSRFSGSRFVLPGRWPFGGARGRHQRESRRASGPAGLRTLPGLVFPGQHEVYHSLGVLDKGPGVTLLCVPHPVDLRKRDCKVSEGGGEVDRHIHEPTKMPYPFLRRAYIGSCVAEDELSPWWWPKVS